MPLSFYPESKIQDFQKLRKRPDKNQLLSNSIFSRLAVSNQLLPDHCLSILTQQLIPNFGKICIVMPAEKFIQCLLIPKSQAESHSAACLVGILQNSSMQPAVSDTAQAFGWGFSKVFCKTC